jgi:putative transposase
MVRLPRLTLPGQVHLITLQGLGGQAVFLDDEDRQRWVDWMGEYARAERVALHAYVLLPHRVRMLATPETASGVPRWIQALGRRYGRHFNDAHGRRGTLWEGRYRSTLIEPGPYLLPAMVFLDIEPVREGLVAHPQDMRWSSYAHYAGLRTDRVLTPPAAYWALGNTPFAREAAYAERVLEGLDARTWSALEQAARDGWALGSEPFVASLQQQAGRRVVKGRAGRPRKAGSASD